MSKDLACCDGDISRSQDAYSVMVVQAIDELHMLVGGSLVELDGAGRYKENKCHQKGRCDGIVVRARSFSVAF